MDTITSSPEAKFNTNVLFVLDKIKERALYSKKGSPIEYIIVIVGSKEKGSPKPEDEESIVDLLFEWQAINILQSTKSAADDDYTALTYYLRIRNPKFEELYQKYKKLVDALGRKDRKTAFNSEYEKNIATAITNGDDHRLARDQWLSIKRVLDLLSKELTPLEIGEQSISLNLSEMSAPVRKAVAPTLKHLYEEGIATFEMPENPAVISSETARQFFDGQNILIKNRYVFEEYRKKISDLYSSIEQDGRSRFPKEYPVAGASTAPAAASLTPDTNFIDPLSIPYKNALFLVRTFYGHIVAILEAFSTGYLLMRDEYLNAKYINYLDNLNKLLDRKDLAKLKEGLPQDLPEHLLENWGDMDIWWEYGKPAVMNFSGSIETLWVRAGLPIFDLPEWLIKDFSDIGSAIAQHSKIKADQWDIHLKRIDDENARNQPAPKQQEQAKMPGPMQVEIVNPELLFRNVEETPIIKGAKRLHYPKFNQTEWAKVTFRFLDEQNVLITADKKANVPSSYEGLNFADGKRNMPNLAWKFLLALARKDGETDLLPTPIPDNVKQLKRQIADRLKTIFKNDTDPFFDPSETRKYKIKIKLIPPPTGDQAQDDLGIQEELKGNTAEGAF